MKTRIKDAILTNPQSAYIGKSQGRLFLIPGKHFAGEEVLSGHVPIQHERLASSIDLWDSVNSKSLYFSTVHGTINIENSSQSWTLAFAFGFLVLMLLAMVKRRRYIVGLWKAYLKIRKEEKLRKRGINSKKRASSEDDVSPVLNNGKSVEKSLLRAISVSEDVLGFGSHGTVVYKGTFEGRPVAVKRLLVDFFDVAETEVKLLRDSDHHPNVVRYYAKEQTDKYVPRFFLL